MPAVPSCLLPVEISCPCQDPFSYSWCLYLDILFDSCIWWGHCLDRGMCCGLSACPTLVLLLKPNHRQSGGVRGGDSGRWLGPECGALMDDVSALRKELLESFISLSLPPGEGEVERCSH